MHRFVVLFIISLICSSSSFAQTFSISGIVRDQKETLPGASVYIASTKIATLTNNDGKFVINNLAPGNYDILVQMIGYMPYQIAVSIKGKSETLDIQLKENVTQLREVIIKPDSNRETYLAWFRQQFIGTSANAKDCKILNPEVLITSYNKQNRVLTVTSTDFMIIENKALGYKLKYLLSAFEMDQVSSITYYEGYPFFEEMKGSKSKLKKWNEARRKAFLGSKVHFYRSLFDNKANQEGFTINKLIEMPNPNRLPDSVINAKLKKEQSKNNGLMALTFTKSDSLAFFLKERNKPKTVLVLNRAAIKTDTLVKSFDKDLKQMNFDNSLYVIYDKASPEDGFSLSGHQVATPPDLGSHQISTLRVLSPPLKFFRNGEVENPRSSLYAGYWSYKKIADFLPLDYKLEE